MGGTNFHTDGSGKMYRLAIKGIKPVRALWQVTIMCGSSDIDGTANSNGLAVGADGQLETWLAPGESYSFLTDDLAAVVWQDVTGAASVVGMHWEVPRIICLPAAGAEGQVMQV